MKLSSSLCQLMLLKLGDTVLASLSQSDEGRYLDDFDSIQAATYSIADGDLPFELNACKNDSSPPSREVTVQASNGLINSSEVLEQCGGDSVCTIPLGTTFEVDASLNLGALIVKGVVEWTDDTQGSPSAFLCSGYVAVEGQGRWEMNLQDKNAFIYLKDNGAVHEHLRSRAFGSFASTNSDYPTLDITGRELTRTWSLLSRPARTGDGKLSLMHNAHLMDWRVGDRIALAPTEQGGNGYGEEFTVVAIDEKGSVLLNEPVQRDHAASFIPKPADGVPALLSAEVVNLSRNIVITGDDFKHVPCNPNLPEAVPGEQTSVMGCRCSSFRSKCTIGLHTAAMHGGSARIQNIRIERCGQRGVEGKYCLHFHKLADCPTCLFKNNAIEGSHQRGVIVHSTFSSVTEGNVLYNVRGAGIYIEDGNEMYNGIRYNVVICPNPFSHQTLHGCTVPGTSGRIADTSDNQAGIFTRSATNALIGNRVANARNGMLLKAGSIGRGESYDKVCESAAKLGRYEGNTFHGNSRFGTYALGFNYPKRTDQSILTGGHNIDKELCSGFDSSGYDRGLSAAIVDNFDWGNAFVGHYEAGDIQYQGHHSYNNNNLIYWKETKPFQNGCSAHISGSSYREGTMALPDQGTFLIENTVFGQGVELEANHHCNVGSTGVLCFPTYMLHNVQWKNTGRDKWVWFQWQQLQSHGANQNFGGVFTLSPPDAEQVMTGGLLPYSLFPPGYVSLVSSKYTYLLGLPGNPCVSSAEYGERYDGGILCKVPLRGLKVYTRGLSPGSAANLLVEIWYGKEEEAGAPDSSQIIGFHQTGSSGPKQGYSLPVIPSAAHSYRLSLANSNGDLPLEWVVEFGDFVIGNRWDIEYIRLSLNGRLCGQNGLVSSHHDRRFMWSGNELMSDEAWGNTGACAASKPPDFDRVDCSLINDGVMLPEECSELCNNSCDETTSYCDCGSATCKLKPGFTETHDLCEDAARCGEHGSCAQYLGGDLPVTSNACICEEGWSGPLCQYNPCVATGKTCSGHGTCVATSDTDAKCLCDDGFSGDTCEETCSGFCEGVFPYGCATNVDGIQRYGCHENGGCHYLRENEEYPFDGFCTYKQAVQDEECLCGTDNGCQLTTSCNPDGSCPTPQYAADATPCHSVPFGTCQSGSCVAGDIGSSPTKGPTNEPTRRPSSPTSQITNNPTHAPTSSAPTAQICGCQSCAEAWVTLATDSSGSYTCGGRITWLRDSQGYNETAACERVSDDFPDICPCNPASCAETMPPSAPPTPSPTPSPTPTATYCGCTSCTQEVYDALATDGAGTYSCGSRIEWLQSAQGYSEADACQRVSEEFPGTCPCNTNSCMSTPEPSPKPSASATENPTRPPSKSPSAVPTTSPTKMPSLSPTWPPSTITPTSSPTAPQSQSPSKKPTTSGPYCGCSTCTDEVWNMPVTDGAGTFTCGDRISFLQTAEGGAKSLQDSCKQVSDEFSSGQCGPACNPLLCNDSLLEDPDPSTLIWKDEFDVDGAPDPSKWTYDLGDGCDIGLCNWGNGEVAYYTSNNAIVSNGVLSINARKESGFSLPYTSARMVTRGLQTFKYGRVQFRASLAGCKAVGTWPALWMLPEYRVYGGWPNSGEIDVMEAVGHNDDRFYGTVHTTNFNGMFGTQRGGNIVKDEEEWHTFEIDWEEDRILFAVDKQVYFVYPREDPADWPFGQEFHLIMNVAVGGTWGGQQGIDEASFEGEGQTLQVDWVRVYSSPNQPQPPTDQPSASPPTGRCGCSSCTEAWDTFATDSSGSYTCGGRITWLQDYQGFTETAACERVSNEFPEICPCNPASCAETPAPSVPPTPAPTPSPVVTYCGCNSCTQEVYNAMATDGAGTYSCGSRIEWLQSAQGYIEADACQRVSEEFPGICGPSCNPTECSSTNSFV